MDIIHTCLNVTDMDESLAFYTEELGLEETWGFTREDTENRYVQADNGIEIQLASTEGVDDVDVGDAWDHLAITVDDLDATLEAVDHYGLVQGPLDVDAADARVAFIEDPDGHVLELVQPLG